MVVNSISFLLFFTAVFVVYYLPICKRTARFQNAWVFMASYFFYGFADWNMIPLLFGTTVVFYGVGLWLKSEMEKGHSKNASRITTLGVVLGIAVLLYFKYLNFFAESFANLLSAIGFEITWSTLNIALPIGVSFFTFKLISYVIEVHREHIEPSKDFIEFGSYVAFFPTILSGPIDRPNIFIPQLKQKRSFDYNLALDGSRQILWGMFTKMCIADNLAVITDGAWNGIGTSSSSTLLLAFLLYPLQMYADFDGYSNMAIGVAKLLGLRVARNFNHPFLARNIAEYWRNWHISLTGWLTDYVFTPLNIAFRSLNNLGVILAIIINFVIIGFWHGASWTYGLFGLYHGLLYIPLILSGAFAKKKKIRPNEKGLPKSEDFLKMVLTYCLVALGLILFRAASLGEALDFTTSMFTVSILSIPSLGVNLIRALVVMVCLILLVIMEWRSRNYEHPLQMVPAKSVPRWCIYVVLTMLIFTQAGDQVQFIYFQF